MMPLTFERDAVRFGAAAARKKKSNENQLSTCLGENIFRGIRDVWIWRSIFIYFFKGGKPHLLYKNGRNDVERHLRTE